MVGKVVESLNGKLQKAGSALGWLTALMAVLGWFSTGYASHARQADLDKEVAARRVRDAEMRTDFQEMSKCLHSHIEKSEAMMAQQIAILERVERRVERRVEK